MTSLEELYDIRALINEIYSDATDEGRLGSRDCFRRYCTQIENDLLLLDALKAVFVYICDMQDGELKNDWISSSYDNLPVDDKKIMTKKQFGLIKKMLLDK